MPLTGGVSNSSSAGSIQPNQRRPSSKMHNETLSNGFKAAQEKVSNSGNFESKWLSRFIDHEFGDQLNEKIDVQQGENFGNSLVNPDINSQYDNLFSGINRFFHGDK